MTALLLIICDRILASADHKLFAYDLPGLSSRKCVCPIYSRVFALMYVMTFRSACSA
ncbi:hypothetical protein C1752_06128 [Acaryochloris thomasi RCC1774]|uniref:Uncharacterized protein n=1 Tax=Acaryochloris thomasi RCC1774 TaxID=1764569 RepID=A0A2W1JCB1_9CYAN|nr:hypothetical protein C1752_06128 [Acaryochloris thomasi RCC1774]